MNNWFNFSIPRFNEQYGSDWDSFNDIVEDNVDYIYAKTEQLYSLKDPGRLSVQAIEKALSVRGIEFSEATPISVKRKNLRAFVLANKSKGMSKVYLDYAEAVVGQRGQVYNGYSTGSWVWGASKWPTPSAIDSSALIHSTPQTLYDIYIDVKTENSDLLDDIVYAFRQSFLLPAFYKIHLVNSSLQVLRRV